MSIAVERPTTVGATVGGKEITFESGKLAKQADGAVLVRSGDTMVLATAVGRTEPREGADFFPLTVDVEERMYAAGKIPGGFFKREGRPTERAILTARMIDRPIRPLWPSGFRNEVQVIGTVLSGRPRHPARHPLHQRRLRGADDLATAVPRAGRRRADRRDRRRVRRQPDAAGERGGVDHPRPDRRGNARQHHHGRGRRGGDPRGPAARGARPCPGGDQQALRRAGGLRRQVGKAKWLDEEVTEEIESQQGERIRERLRSEGLREAAAVLDELQAELCPELTMDSTEEDIIRHVQVRASLNLLMERYRLEVVEEPVRQQFEADLRALTEAEQDSKELKSAKRQLLFERIIDEVQLPFPVGPATVDGDHRRSRTR